MNAAQNILRVRNLQISATEQIPGQHSRQIVIVDDISLELRKGRVLGLIGESGAGKSTIGLASMAYGRGGCEITGGEVWLDGKNILEATPGEVSKLRGAKVAYVAQSAAASFNPAHRLGRQVIEAVLQHGLMSRDEANAFAVELFTRLGLPDPQEFGYRYPHHGDEAHARPPRGEQWVPRALGPWNRLAPQLVAFADPDLSAPLSRTDIGNASPVW